MPSAGCSLDPGRMSSGRSNAAGSRCAAARSNIIVSPLGRSTSPIVISSAAIRPTSCTGGSYRSVSSMIIGARSGSPASSDQYRGWRSIARIALAIRFTVVSWPAISSRLQVATISSVGQLVAVLLSRDQRRDQVLAGHGPRAPRPDRHVPAQPVPGLHAFVKAVGHFTGERDEGVESLCEQRRGSAELRLILDRHTQHPADHRDRQRMGQVGDGIEIDQHRPPRRAIRRPST